MMTLLIVEDQPMQYFGNYVIAPIGSAFCGIGFSKVVLVDEPTLFQEKIFGAWLSANVIPRTSKDTKFVNCDKYL